MIGMGDPELIRDPFSGYSRIREQAPLVRGVMPGVEPVWIVTRYDDVKMVLSDPRFVVDPGNVPGMQVPSLFEQMLRTLKIPEEYLQYRLARMSLHDAADHARLRKLVTQAFTVQRVAKLRHRVEDLTEGLLDQLSGLADHGVVDLLRDFAHPLSGAVLCELVGIPTEDRARWQSWSTVVSPVKGQDQAQGWREVVAYTRELIEWRRAQPSDDLVSGLVQAQGEDGGRLNDTEMISMIIMLGLTSQQAAHLISNGTFALLTHPDQLALLQADPSLMPRAVHELLRWRTPTTMTPRVRYATEDLEIGGMPVRKGEPVAPILVAANYDPRIFPDPERLDITRERDGHRDTHVSFGGGPHLCLGAAVARQEGEVAFSALFRRFPRLSLAIDPHDVELELLPGSWQLAALPVRLSSTL